MNFITHHPLFFAGLSLRRAFSYWTGFWSVSPAYLSLEPMEIPDIVYCTGVTVLMLLGARRFWQRDRTSALPYVVLILAFPLTYYFTHASPDYREPIEPEVLVLAVGGMQALRRATEPALVLDETAEEDEKQMAMAMSAIG
jgi:hypothetical protein